MANMDPAVTMGNVYAILDMRAIHVTRMFAKRRITVGPTAGATKVFVIALATTHLISRGNAQFHPAVGHVDIHRLAAASTVIVEHSA